MGHTQCKLAWVAIIFINIEITQNKKETSALQLKF